MEELYTVKIMLIMAPHAEDKVLMSATCGIAFNDDLMIKKFKQLSDPSCHSFNLSF